MITLTGFMGSGKTTVGKVLADFLGCPFMDLDDLIVKKAGKSIPEIFTEDGEAAFRQLEARLLRQTVEKYTENTVVLEAKPPAARWRTHPSPTASPRANLYMNKPPMSSLTRTVFLRTRSRTRLLSPVFRTTSNP